MEVPEHEHQEYDCPTNQALLEVLKEAARETGAEVNTIVIKYLLLEHGFQVIPTVGIKTPQGSWTSVWQPFTMICPRSMRTASGLCGRWDNSATLQGDERHTVRRKRARKGERHESFL